MVYNFDAYKDKTRADLIKRCKEHVHDKIENYYEIKDLKKQLIHFKLAYADAMDAVDYAASEGFNWLTDPITPDIKFVIKTYSISNAS